MISNVVSRPACLGLMTSIGVSCRPLPAIAGEITQRTESPTWGSPERCSPGSSSTTQTRIDLGFALGARPAEGRLIDTGGFAKKDRITHRIPISSLAEIDDEVKHWLRTAFEEDR